MNTAHHLFWITSRAAGTMALIGSSVSVTIGVLIGRRAGGRAGLPDLRVVHECLSVLVIAMIALHGAALLGDRFFHPGLSGIAIPFAGSYRSAWTAVGIVSGYGLAALGLSYYVRDRIGPARWRRMHAFTALFWLFGVVHSIGAGSDARQAWFLLVAGMPVCVAAIVVSGRLIRGVGKALDLPRAEPPIRQT